MRSVSRACLNMHHNESNTESAHVVFDTRDKALLPCACSFNWNLGFPTEEARNIGSRISLSGYFGHRKQGWDLC